MNKIDFDKNAFENAFPPMPASAHNKVIHALHQVKQPPMQKHKARLFSFVLAAVLVLALAGAALAAYQSGVLDYLLGNGSNANQAQLNMVQPLGLSHTGGGITTTVTDALFDGENFSLGLVIDMEKPIYVATNGFTMNGQEVFLESWDLSAIWLTNPLLPGAGTVTKGYRSTLQEYLVSDYLSATSTEAEYDAHMEGFKQLQEEIAQTGEATITFSLKYMAATQGVELINYSEPTANEQIKACIARGNTPVALGHEEGPPGYYVVENPEWVELLSPMFQQQSAIMESASGSLTAEQQQQMSSIRKQYAAILNDQSLIYPNMEVVDTFTMDVTIQMTGDKLDVTPKETYQGNDVVVTFDQVTFTPLASNFHFSIQPLNESITLAEIQDRYFYYAFFDESKNPLAFQDTQVIQDCGLETLADGSTIYQAHLRMPALDSLPQTIYLVPTTYTTGGYHDPQWEYAIPLSIPSTIAQ